MFKSKHKRIYDIAKTATWDVLCSLDYAKKVEEKYPKYLYKSSRMRLVVGNFEDPAEAMMFMRQFKKFIAEFEKLRTQNADKMIYVLEYNPDTEE